MNKYDFIIIGSGASGAAACYELCKSGKSVLCIEKGGFVEKSEVPSNFSDWEVRKNSSFSFNPNIRDNKCDYSIDTSNSPIDIALYNGVGGSTVLFSGHYPRFHVSDFKVKSLDGVADDWPIDYWDLESIYKENEIFLGVSGLNGDPSYPSDFSHLRKEIDLGIGGNLFANAMNELSWHWWPSYSAILTSDFNDRKSCNNSGPCNTGCPTGSKSSADVTYIKESIQLGLELLTNTSVNKIIVKDDAAVGVITLDENCKSKSFYADKILLAANGIGTLRILFNSKDGDDYLGNSSGMIGKNFMIHPLGYVEGVLKNADDLHIGPQGSWLASHEFYESNKNNDFVRGYSMHFLKGWGPAETAYNNYLKRKYRFEDKENIKKIKERVKNLASIAIVCEDLPSQDNFIEMQNELDKDYLPKVKVNYQLDDNTKKMLNHGLNNAKKLFKKIGAKEIFGYGPIRFAGWHITGTTRMGNSKLNSVVNKFGEMHDIKNLYIVDGGVFVTSSGVNPANTIQSVSRYIARGILNGDN